MKNFRAVLLEAVVLAIGGLILALAANALSPRGLRLGRDYFPGGEASRAATTNTVSSGSLTKAPDETATALARLAQRGLQSVSSNEVTMLFRDPRREQGLIVFVDARADTPYQAGHIPGAWQFDHYRAEQFIPAVLPLCMSAQQVIVYCNGGSCEDSEFAAITLRNAGVPPASLSVYVGGITEWRTTGLPVETGARLSGQLAKP